MTGGVPAVGWRWAPGVVQLRQQRLAGGTPYRIIRLSVAGQAVLAGLLGTAGRPEIGSAAAALSARLVGYGLLIGPAPPVAAALEVTVVIPARSSPGPVRALLAALPTGVPVVLVDDGSPSGLAARVPPRPGLVHIRHDVSRGPAAARNAGARQVTTPWIAFVDADIVPGPDALAGLSAYATGNVVAVAPRICNAPTGGRGGLAAFIETYAAGLDLGPTPGDVGRGAMIGYVPSAMLLVDRAAFDRVGGFDETMTVAEDVDLVWRLRTQGGIRYQPEVVVRHAPRSSTMRVLVRRYTYGTGAARLERRHPGAVRHADVAVWSFGPWLLGVVVHPALGLLAAVGAVAAAPFTLPDLPARDALRLAGQAQVIGLLTLGRWTLRPLWPLTLLLIGAGGRRRPVLVAVLASALVDTVRRGDSAHPARGLLAHTLDDLAYSVGVLAGCLRTGRLQPLLPRVRRAGVRRPRPVERGTRRAA